MFISSNRTNNVLISVLIKSYDWRDNSIYKDDIDSFKMFPDPVPYCEKDIWNNNLVEYNKIKTKTNNVEGICGYYASIGDGLYSTSHFHSFQVII